MTPDERRRALIEATRPLLLEHGTTVSTRQIAECAGVAEGTIFRAFGTKQQLIESVLDECLTPGPLTDAIHAIDANLDLTQTVTAIIDLLQRRIQQIRALMSAVSQQRTHGTRRKPPHSEFHGAVNAAITARLQPFERELSVPVGTACWAISAVAFAASLPFLDDPAAGDPRRAARLILHGIAEHCPKEQSC